MEGNENLSPDSHNSSGESAVEDLKLLIDCIKYQTDDTGYQKQALKTIASICHTSDKALEHLVHSDGLQYIIKIIFNTTISHSLKVECLHVLCVICENNVLAQQMLCEETIFMVIKKFLTMNSNPVLQTLSGYFLICLVTNNEKGQVLVRTTRCLEILRYLFKDVRSPLCSPRNRNGTPDFPIANQTKEQEYLMNLWQTATSALTVSVNNPQNNENQVFCSSAFPAAVAYLRNSQSSIIQATTLSFITNCLANNNRTQVSFRLVGGLRVLSDVLRAELGTDDQLPSKMLNNLMLALGAAVCGNKLCRDSAAEVEIIPLLLQCTQLSFAAPQFKVECLITIAACIEECVPNCLAFSAHDGVSTVIEMLAQYQNCEELKKSATYVLHSYMKQTKSLDPSSLDNVLSSKVIHDGSSSATASQIGETYNGSTLSANLVEPRSECDVVNKVNDGVVKKSISASTSDGMVKNKIKDLTEDVQFLKQLFTNRENKHHVSIVKDVKQSLMDIINAVCNIKVLAVPQSDIQKEQVDLDNNDTTTVKMTGMLFNNHTNTEEKQLPVPLSNDITVEEVNHTTIASHLKDTTTTTMMGSDLTSSTERGKSHLDNHTATSAMQHTTSTTQGSPVQSDIHVAHGTPLVQEKDSSHMASPTFDILDNGDEICDPASEISDAGDVNTESRVPSTECEDNFGANMRYGVTPDNQTRVANTKRPRKKSPAMINKSRKYSSKRTLQITPKKKKRSALDDVIVEETSLESSSDESMIDIFSLSSSTKTPIKFSNINNIGPSQAKRREKVIAASKCLGCCGDLNELNSRNFISKLRSNSHTCSRHRDFVKQISSALRKIKNISERKQRSPNFDFIPSPKLNASREATPAEILKRVMPKQKVSRRSKVPFSEKEIEILKKGYEKYGSRWSLIEKNCQFSVKRTATTLKQKFKSLSKSIIKRNKILFAPQEERNLRHGVSLLGYSWRKILNRYSFHEERTPQSLRDKWRNMTKYTL